MNQKIVGVVLDEDVVAEVDTKIGRASRSAWIRQAMQLRLMIEGAANAHEHPSGQWAREILAIAARGDTSETAQTLERGA